MCSRKGQTTVFLICLLWQGFSAGPAAAKNEDCNSPELVPGRETRVDCNDKKMGGGYFLVYVPADYNDSRDWPVIFFYPGAGLPPSTNLFRQITDGKGFVIVAMEYVTRSEKMTMGRYLNYLKAEQRSLGAAKRYLSQRLKIDRTRLFLTGISKGGWLVSTLADRNPAGWNGIAIFCAGRSTLLEAEDTVLLKGRRIYIGAGQTDQNLAAAKKAAAYYERVGADVTFEIYAGLGHAVDTNSLTLRNWLTAGPQQAKGKRTAELNKGPDDKQPAGEVKK